MQWKRQMSLNMCVCINLEYGFEYVCMHHSGIRSKHSNAYITQESAVHQFQYKICPFKKGMAQEV